MSPLTPTFGAVVLGTDTGVGKTAVGMALLRLALRRHLRAVPFKPVETGCDGSTSSDHARLLAAASVVLPLEEVCPHRFAAPVAPALAASQAGVCLTAAGLAAAAARAALGADYFHVETAGGLLTPYGPRFTAADLAAALRLPVLLVARNGLGTINHTSLAVNELRRRHLPVAVLLLVDTASLDTPDRPHNAALIAEHAGITPLATLPFVPDPDPDRLADALAAQVSPAALFERLRCPAAG